MCSLRSPSRCSAGFYGKASAPRAERSRDALVAPQLQALARSSPEDKILVEKLKELGEIVGVTGDGTNDCSRWVEISPWITIT